MEEKDLQLLYRAQYDYEISQRDGILNRLQLPVGIIVALAGALGYLIQKTPLNVEHLCVPLEIYWAALLISGIIFAVSLGLFARGLFHTRYKILPTSDVIQKYRVELLEYHKEDADCQSIVAAKMSEYVAGKYALCASHNAKINDARIGFIYNCNGFLVACAVSILVTFSIFTFGGIEAMSGTPPTTLTVDAPNAEVRVNVHGASSSVNPPPKATDDAKPVGDTANPTDKRSHEMPDPRPEPPKPPPERDVRDNSPGRAPSPRPTERK